MQHSRSAASTSSFCLNNFNCTQAASSKSGKQHFPCQEWQNGRQSHPEEMHVKQAKDQVSQKSGDWQRCSRHDRLYEYVCCSCMELKCKLCLSQRCGQDEQSLWDQHQVISIKKYQQNIRNSCEELVDARMHECAILDYRKHLLSKSSQMQGQIAALDAQTIQCAELLQENLATFRSIVMNQIRVLEEMYSAKVQIKRKQIQDQKILQQIANCEDEHDCSRIIVREWSRVKQAISGITHGKQAKLNEYEVDNITHKCSQVVQTIRKCYHFVADQLRKTKKIIQHMPTQSTITVLNESHLTPGKAQSKSPRHLTSSRLSSTPAGTKRPRAQLMSITNIINQQIHQKQRMDRGNGGQNLYLYGGRSRGQIFEIVHLAAEQKKNRELGPDAQEGSSHVGFGHIVLSNKMARQLEFAVVGGYMNQEITDCIFRTRFSNAKKELVGRLDEPLANFGFQSCPTPTQKGHMRAKLYICGGQSQKGRPTNKFFTLQFSEGCLVPEKSELPRFDQPRHSLTLTFHKSFMYAIGGVDYQNKVLKIAQKFCLQSKTWTRVGDLCYPRSSHRTVSLNSGLYVIGGWNGQNCLRSVQRFCQNKQQFKILMDMKQPRSNFGCLPCRQTNSILILGGKAEHELGSCEQLSIKLRSSNYVRSLPSAKSDFWVVNAPNS